jgi:type IX secretion system PorP/SprF family membrane protein
MKQNRIIQFVACCFISSTLIGQQAPMFTHYMFNTLTINPAYAGSRDALSVTALHRSQWLDFKGAPMSQTFTMNSPVANKHIGLGLSLSNDKIGPVNNTSAFFSFSYKIVLSQRAKLSLGLSGGMNVLQTHFTDLDLDQQNDPAFSINSKNNMSFNAGFGAYYARERFYLGVSVPNLIQNKFPVVTLANGNQSSGTEKQHYYFITGTHVDIRENIAFKPTALMKFTEGAPIQIDLTAAFIFNHSFSLGAMYRTGDALGLLLGWMLSPQFTVGYSYDWSHNNRTFDYNMGSHELMLRYEFSYTSNKQIHSPRYF